MGGIVGSLGVFQHLWSNVSCRVSYHGEFTSGYAYFRVMSFLGGDDLLATLHVWLVCLWGFALHSLYHAFRLEVVRVYVRATSYGGFLVVSLLGSVSILRGGSRVYVSSH